MGLRFKLAIPVVLSLVVFALALHFIWFKDYVEQQRTVFISQQQEILLTLSPSLSRSIYASDLAAVHGTLDQQLINMQPVWKSFTLNDIDGKRLYPLNNNDIQQSEYLLEIAYPIYHEEEKVAQARLLVDWESIFENGSTHKTAVELILLSIFSVVMLATLLWQKNWILNPLTLLEQAAIKLNQKSYDEQLPRVTNDELGSLTQAFKVMRDELRTSRSELEERVASRTEELQAEKTRAEEANKAKSKFLSSMSHELRTPLNAIIGFGQLLEIHHGKILPDDAKHQLTRIRQSGHHLLDLINQILDLSRIEAGHLDIKLQPVALANAINECIVQVDTGLTNPHEISIINQIEDLDYYVLTDPLRFKQVIINLLSNALKYNHEGGFVKIETEAIANNRLRIIVADSGNGISANDMTHLFEPFERLSNAHSNIEGTGIGLTVTKTLVDAMNGTIYVESEVGKGSKFCVELPLASNKNQNILTTTDGQN